MEFLGRKILLDQTVVGGEELLLPRHFAPRKHQVGNQLAEKTAELQAVARAQVQNSVAAEIVTEVLP